MKADRFEREMKEQSVKWKRTATSHLGKQPSHLAHTLSRPLQMFWKSRSLVPINGSVPLSNVYKRTPQLQMSAGLPYDCLCTTSGAIKWGVPTLPVKESVTLDFIKYYRITEKYIKCFKPINIFNYRSKMHIW